MAKFNIINKAEELTNYILDILEKSPKKIRFDIVLEIRKKILLITEYIVRANHYPINGSDATLDTIAKRRYFQDECLTELDILNTFLEISNKHNYLTNNQLANATKLSTELSDMISKWIVSDDARKNK